MTTVTVLIILAFILFFLEIFLPGGILAVLGSLLILWAAYLVYLEGGFFAAAMVIILSGAGGLAMFFLELRLLQHTRFGRRLGHEGVIRGASNRPQADTSLIGQEGEALTAMAPSGKVLVGGAAYEAASESGFLEKGTAIVVVRIDNLKIMVRKK